MLTLVNLIVLEMLGFFIAAMITAISIPSRYINYLPDDRMIDMHWNRYGAPLLLVLNIVLLVLMWWAKFISCLI